MNLEGLRGRVLHCDAARQHQEADMGRPRRRRRHPNELTLEATHSRHILFSQVTKRQEARVRDATRAAAPAVAERIEVQTRLQAYPLPTILSET